MTQYRHPDYDIGLYISLSDFHAIAGVAFRTTIIFGENHQQVPGMLIIPQGNGFPEATSTATAWLWAEDHPDSPVETKVGITIGKPYDPMLTPEEHLTLSDHSGLTLEGVITKNWDTEPRTGGDA